ncbi:MAG: DUF2339 domain-containing protein [Rhizobiaceae bacterium]|nr:DUF2339 domain-containing protein [Rhizobiaceae bacterium]
MFELLSLIAVALAIAGLSTARGVRNRLESELAELRQEIKRLEGLRLAGSRADDPGPETASDTAMPVESVMAGTVPVEETAPLPADMPAAEPEPVAVMEAPAEPAVPPVPAKPKQSLESRIAAQWTVWVGGLALALAGIFTVKYSIDQGLFSPAVRLSAAAIFGFVLIAVGEVFRRRERPEEGAAFRNAMIPGVLTAAGTLTLFGAVYVAHGFYGYFGPATAFVLLALVSVLTLGLSMLHGQALAGLGLLGSFTTPLLVQSTNPTPWPLFGFVSLVWIATTLASRIQRWNVVQGLANVGLSLWVLTYLSVANPLEVPPPLLSMLVMIAGVAFLWPGAAKAVAEPEPELEPDEAAIRLDSAGRPVAARRRTAWDDVFFPRHAITTLTAGLFSMLVAVAFVTPDLVAQGMSERGFLAVVVALALFGALRFYAAYPAIFAAIAAVAGIRVLTFGAASPGFSSPADVLYANPDTVIWLSLGLGLFFALTALANVFVRRASRPEFVRVWIVIGAVTPLALATFSFFFFGNYQFDLKHGVHAVILGSLFLGGAIAFYGEADREGRFDVNRDLMVAASWAFFVFALVVMTDGIVTTIGAAVLGFAYLNGHRVKDWPSLPWAMVASAAFVAGRIAWEPTIVGAQNLSTTPVFNQLLAGYGIPAALLVAAAWLTRHSPDGRLRAVLEALASLFTLLTIAILVRHAMNGGVLTSDVPTLAEQAIYTLLAIGASATLMGLDLRHPSIVFRTGSMAVGYLSMASVFIAHMLTLNPYFTGETTGAIAVFNLLFLAYLLPGLAYAGAAWMAASRRPRHYVIALSLSGAALVFAYVTLSVRRFYHGADISDWKGFLQSELYTYSVVWLLLGVALLVAGYRFRSTALRIASAVLVFIAVVKVFLVDMSNLEGLYRALSFFGLGVALIGIGWFYQKALTGLARQEKPETASPEPQA